MIHLLNPTSDNFKQRRSKEGFAVACSGGYDSMAALHFFCRGGWRPLVIHVDHGTGNSAAITPIMKVVKHYGLCLNMYTIDNSLKSAKESQEEFWRNQRMAIFNRDDMPPVVTGHNLNDAMETWVFSSVHGASTLIPYNTWNVYRPFLLTPKIDLFNYVVDNGVPWHEDVSNEDTAFTRNRIRHNIIPEVLKVNPGFDKVIRKKYLERYNAA